MLRYLAVYYEEYYGALEGDQQVKEGEPKHEQLTPRNLTITWGKGGKSLVTTESFAIRGDGPHKGWINGNSMRQEFWHEAPPGEQLNETICYQSFAQTLVLAKKHPQREYHFIRIDIDTGPTTPNNDYDRGEKYIHYEGYLYKPPIHQGWYGEGEPTFPILMSDGSNKSE